MPRKRDGFVPLGDVADEVELSGDRVLARRADTPPARRHFTRLDQMVQLVGASEADPELGYIARLLALCSLPRTNPGNRLQYVRRNGPYTLVMSCASTAKLPYGPLPRLLLAWITTEAVRTQNPVLVLENSLSAFMQKLGLESSGGAGRIRLRNQMDRLFNAAVSLTYEDKRGKRFMSSTIVESGEFWWNLKRPEERSLWESKIELAAKFFEEIVRRPVPLDMNILREIKRSSLGLDIYLWLVYRTFALKAPMRLSWKALYRQFGVEPSKASDRVTVDNFRKDCLRELVKIKGAWPGMQYHTDLGVLVLSPSLPCIQPRHQLTG